MHRSSRPRLRVYRPLACCLAPEVPGLIAWHRDIAPDSDDSVLLHGELNLVALTDVQCLPDRIRQGELRLLAKPRSSVGPRLQFFLDTSLVQGCPPAPSY